ncbi:MAG: HAMP domain-containing sensor histidine kinase, partial [Myxococcota bacterium]|nr:HAMP domain-containing sensor histidine kinase [Myxococcota bacterium]
MVDRIKWFEEATISSAIRADVGNLLRARVTLVAGLLAFILIFSLRLVEMLETPEAIPQVLPRALLSCLMLLPVVLLKRMNSVEIPTAIFSFGVVAAFTITMWGEGGLNSVNLLFVALVPALLRFIASTRVFAISMVGMFSMLLVVGYATWSGVTFEVPVSQSMLLIWSSTVSSLLTAAALAWFIHDQLRSSLQSQEEELGQRRRMEELLRESTRRAEAANRSKDAFLAYTSHVHDQLQSSLQIQERELSQRRRMEGLLRASTRSAEAANRSKDAFLAYISHEIRNPLTSILGAVELFSTSSDAESRARYLPAIEASGNNLLRLVNRLLDLSKLQAGRVDLEVNRVHVRQLIDEMASATRGYVGSRPVEVAGRVDTGVPLYVGLDETRIRQVLSNLLSNAAKNTPRGRIEVEVTDVNGAALKVAITDTGLGIPGDALQQVFEEYTQVGDDSDGIFSGTGLGLSIVRESLKLMDGEVHMESEVGQGTQVYVTIPYTAPPTAASLTSSLDTQRLRSG